MSSFHPSQITSPLRSPAHGTSNIGGSRFPSSFGTPDQRLAALERAMVNIEQAIVALADQIDRLGREAQARL